MNVQNPSFQVVPARPESAIQPGYMSGFGNGFETEALPGPCLSDATRLRNAPTAFTPSS